jgi:hypothetical protein
MHLRYSTSAEAFSFLSQPGVVYYQCSIIPCRCGAESSSTDNLATYGSDVASRLPASTGATIS